MNIQKTLPSFFKTIIQMAEAPMIHVRIALTGGLELIFQKRKTFTVELPQCTLDHLIMELAKQCDPKKLDVFVQDGTVRPGILVLINESDWELEGEGAYVVQDNDEILFVSTLHGG